MYNHPLFKMQGVTGNLEKENNTATSDLSDSYNTMTMNGKTIRVITNIKFTCCSIKNTPVDIQKRCTIFILSFPID